jgi:hypothetical protein
MTVVRKRGSGYVVVKGKNVGSNPNEKAQTKMHGDYSHTEEMAGGREGAAERPCQQKSTQPRAR